MPVDLDAAEAELAALHVIDLREDGFTIRHPLSCRPTLFDCPIWSAARQQLTEPPDQPDRYECWTDDRGRFHLGEVAGDPPEVDWAGMVAELHSLRASIASHHRYIAGLNGGRGCRLCPTGGTA